ncbi:MAG: glycosyltransferase family 2 protein [Bacteriovoracaceae bacterium]|nr:glycosyltransferase family 2 protein [Bacteriovoracaceae bacterium]
MAVKENTIRGWSGNYLSIIIPCYNEALTLEYSKSKLLNLQEQFLKLKNSITLQFIFVNDGSDDDTGAQLEAFKKDFQNSSIVHHTSNSGLGSAVKTGIAHAKGDMVAVLDADCAYSPLLILAMIKHINYYEIVDACPYHPKAPKNKSVPLYRLALSRGVVLIYNLILRKKFFCYTCMVRIYRKYVLQDMIIQENGFLAITEIKVKAILKKISIYEFPAENNYRKFGESKMKILKNIKQHLMFVLKISLGIIK